MIQTEKDMIQAKKVLSRSKPFLRWLIFGATLFLSAARFISTGTKLEHSESRVRDGAIWRYL